MKESTKIISTTIVGTSLLTGAFVFAIFQFLPRHDHHEYSHPKGGMTADDSPVTVRGGSVTLRDAQGFYCTNGTCSATKDPTPDKSVITLDGVQLDTSKPPQTYLLNPQTNWALRHCA
jgi:hypothetical protein